MADIDLARRLHDLARQNSVQITTAESCTGGLLAGAITAVPGASDIFSRGYVTYSNAAKSEMLGVKPSTLKQHGAVSEETASEMAEGALKAAQAQLAIAVTGIAGPGGSDNKPEGRVCFALARRGQPTQSQTVELTALGRAEIRAVSVQHALRMLITALS